MLKSRNIIFTSYYFEDFFPVSNNHQTIKSMKKLALQFILLFLSCTVFSQYAITRIEPPFWWAGMKNSQLEIMVYGPGISELTPVIKHKKINLIETTRVTNPDYLFLLFETAKDLQPCSFGIMFQKDGVTMAEHTYEFLPREEGSASRQGFGNSDVICLITPDRFANGDPGNDNVPGYAEQADRTNKEGRHGGDLKGIASHLDYIEDMGFTAVWLNPVLENNMPRTSYHGYAITDYYKVDPRYGTNEEYRQLSLQMKQRGIALIMDMVANHCGLEHWWMKDLPSADWINCGGEFTGTNHRRSTVQDPHASQTDKVLFPDGWFVKSMPDLNQKNPQMARYLIQNSIWWIEYAGLSGIRQDTYSYPDKDFMARWSCEIMNEYPAFSIVGEEWTENQAIVAYWQKGKANPDGYFSCLGSLMDFPLQMALVQGLTDGEVYYKDGLIKMYETLANDFIYADPDRLVVFPDNHDMHRFFTQVKEDLDLYKMGLAYILTIRGIPQIYYGTEVLMTSPGEKDDGVIRSDFPGGWEKDTVNTFTEAGLTQQQIEAKHFLQKLLAWRKTKSCLHNGKLVHFSPEKGTYVYFRFNEKEKVMVAFNKNSAEITLDGTRFKELTGGSGQGKDVITGREFDLNQITIPARSVIILEI